MHCTANISLSYRTDTCPALFRAAAGADGTSPRTETHWPRALPAKFQFVDLFLSSQFSIPKEVHP